MNWCTRISRPLKATRSIQQLSFSSPIHHIATARLPASSSPSVAKHLSTKTPTSRPTTAAQSSSKLRIQGSAARSIAFIAASSLAGGLSLALYNNQQAASGGVLSRFSGLTSRLGNTFSTSSSKMAGKTYPVDKSDEDWRLQLSAEQFRILRKKGTEMAGSGEYDSHYPSKGVYSCAGCSAPLYNYDSKFKSGCGWPAFFEEIPGSVDRHTDSTFGMQRTEIVCSNCGGHLGHVFKGEGFGHPKDQRHCVNSVSLKYNADAQPPKE